MPTPKDINFTSTREDDILISKIAGRGHAINPLVRLVSIAMDVTAVHLNGCPLRLQDLLDSKNSDFIHDIAGIRDNINTLTGELDEGFFPKFAKKRKGFRCECLKCGHKFLPSLDFLTVDNFGASIIITCPECEVSEKMRG